ncbi:Homeobox protein OTX1 [Mycena venus]|uniref:Homeobox protein OTX1 n=1 Tax=Mycena venus TaxID=2733690 RepID=A0A8H6X3G6_9AGAR|nr:Homeobox protein OTX1 [Mycena venus]
MSKSRSVTPTPNTINLPSSSGLTPSRTPTDDTSTTTTTAAHTTSGEILQPSPAQFTHFHSFVSSQASPYDLLDRRPSPDSPPMAKRMRRQSPEDTSRSHSSDSQSGMADTEDPEGMSPYSETSPPPVAPLKKKRTRTLTTPHQSAVLHALLAQSRFPTTAMREEVGRSIGLSARKVQIWFQNQRQKARRPGSQSDASSQPGPPHYAPFPNAPSSYPGASEHALSHGEREGRAIPHAYSGYPPSEQFLGSVDASPQLLGPGMPGRAPQRGRPVLHLASSAPSRELPLPPFSSRSLPGPRTLDSENFEGTSPFQRIHGNDPSRTLPPLIFNQPSRRQDLPSSSHLMLARSAPTTPSHASSFLTSPSPSPTFAHNIPELQPYSTSALGLPPPFTLQPQPQWDSSSSHRPQSSSWSRSGSHSTRGDSSSPPSSFLKEPSPDDNGDTPRMGPAQPTRSGRYDPVRAMFVTSDSPPPGSSTPPV